jgi:hypothetical protein
MSNDPFQHQEFWNNNKNVNEFKFTLYEAVGIAEGFIEEKDEKVIIAAWQYLLDEGHVWNLQGWFGREATRLLEEGVIFLKK